MRKHIFLMACCLAALAACGPSSDAPEAISPSADPEISAKLPAPNPKKSAVKADIPALPQTIDAGLDAYVKGNLGGDFKALITSTRSADLWDFVCGDLAAPGKSPDQTFCALLKEEDAGFKLLEFEVVGSDAPYYDWFQDHGVPDSIIGD